MSMKRSEFKARLGDHVAFWNRDLVDFDKKAIVAVVIGVGLEGRLDLFAYYTGNATGGSRPYAHVMGAWPGDIDAKKDQITDSGTWIPMKVYHAEMDRREKLAEEKDAKDRADALAAKEAANKPKEKTEEKPKEKTEDKPPTPPTQPPAPPPAPPESEAKPSGRKIQSVAL